MGRISPHSPPLVLPRRAERERGGAGVGRRRESEKCKGDWGGAAGSSRHSRVVTLAEEAPPALAPGSLAEKLLKLGHSLFELCIGEGRDGKPHGAVALFAA